jgi:putative membrane protein
MHIVVSWLILSAAVYVTASTLTGFHVKDFKSAILVAGLFGILNYLLGGVLFVALGIATLGIGFLLGFLTMWVVNSLLLVVTDKLTDHLTIDSFGWAMGGALMISMLSVLGNWLVGMVF